MAITSRQDFIDFIFRRLGAPVIQINVDMEQAHDRLDESLEYMFERHFDFNERAQFVVPVTSENLSTQSYDTTTFGYALGARGVTSASGVTSYWPAASDIRTISKVYSANNQTGDYMFDLRYQMTLFDFFGLYFNQGGLAQGPMATYMEAMQYISLVNDVFNYPVSFTYTRTTNRLFLETQQTQNTPPGTYLMVEAYVQVNPDYYPKVWDDRIFQRHYSALLKKQWAQNLMKYTGIPLPGGASINAGALMQDAVKELADIEALLLRTQELPVDMQIG